MTEELISEENLAIISDLANAVQYVPDARKQAEVMDQRKASLLTGVNKAITKFYSRYDALINPTDDLESIGVDSEAIQKIINFANENR